MSNGISRNHHFVPVFLLESWIKLDGGNQHKLWGYYWCTHSKKLRPKIRGAKGFCHELDLLSLDSHPHGQDAIEKFFFGEVDTKGAKASRILLDKGVRALTHNQRCDFASLLLSLESRRLANVQHIRRDGALYLKDSINDDPEIKQVMAHEGIHKSPSQYMEDIGFSFEDRALTMVQSMTDDPTIGTVLINAHWHVRHLNKHNTSLVLSDRPLIRVNGYDHPGAVWILPLTPYSAFIGCNHEENMHRLLDISDREFAKKLNISSTMQAQKYVFSVDDSHKKLFVKYLDPDHPSHATRRDDFTASGSRAITMSNVRAG